MPQRTPRQPEASLSTGAWPPSRYVNFFNTAISAANIPVALLHDQHQQTYAGFSNCEVPGLLPGTVRLGAAIQRLLLPLAGQAPTDIQLTKKPYASPKVRPQYLSKSITACTACTQSYLSMNVSICATFSSHSLSSCACYTHLSICITQLDLRGLC